ncbi:hypothetical protein Tco_1125712 [Tanacetum coccineum]
MSKRTSLGKAKDKGASLGRGERGGSSSASGNDDQFADDRGNIREYFDEGIRPSSRPAGRGDSSSAENYGKYLEESMLDMESWQHLSRALLIRHILNHHSRIGLETYYWINLDSSTSSKIGKFEKERGGSVSSLEFYQRCHRKRGFVSEYITMRAKNVAEKHLDMMEEMYEEDNSCHPRVGDREIWERVCGGPGRKRSFFGFGSLMDIDLALTCTSSTPSTGGSLAHHACMASSYEVENLKDQLDKQGKVSGKGQLSSGLRSK